MNDMKPDTATCLEQKGTRAAVEPTVPRLANPFGRRAATSGRHRSIRRTLFRLAAIGLGLSPVLVLELVLTALDMARPSRSEDPFVGFSSIRPLFVLNEERTRYEIPRSRLTHFARDFFAAEKGPDEFRIFCIGDSTVQGNPWSIETSFTTWLELSLQVADPSRRWEVVNCGGISYASYRMVPILEEVIRYEPDLIVMHSSHNEFLEDRSYGDIKRVPRLLVRTQEWVSQLRTFNLARSGWLQLCGRNAGDEPKDRTLLAAEVEALLDYRDGVEFYHRDDAWRESVIAHYEFNLRRMAGLARDAGVPLVFMNPVCNLRDSPPFKSEHRDGLTPAELERLEDLWSDARTRYGSDRARALALLQEAVAIDDQHAGLRYDLAKCLDAMGLVEDARREYVAAKELDVCSLRILDAMNQIVLDVARDHRIPVVDVRKLIEERSRHGIPGVEWLVDHVHPSIHGYQAIGNELADEIVRMGFMKPESNWRELRDQKYAEHLASLNALYFAKGQQHLEGLTRWAEGRVTKDRPPK
jgi:tetratricopeptide (TPR) repeat protein